MTVWQKVLVLGAIVAALAMMQVGLHLQRWYRFSEERAVLQELRDRGIDAGVAVIRTRARADTLSQVVAELDDCLSTGVDDLRAYDRHAEGNRLPPHLYASYRDAMNEFETLIRERDRQAGEWRRMLDAHREAVIRYNAIVDSVRTIGAAIGEPYYPVPNPAEAAAERGLIGPEASP